MPLTSSLAPAAPTHRTQAPGRTSHNPSVVGSSPTRPTSHARPPANSVVR
jgi:hypothetical protein